MSNVWTAVGTIIGCVIGNFIGVSWAFAHTHHMTMWQLWQMAF